ncbi:MAG: hypothetical protein M1549_04255 [Candidatus Dependentiae bacterium]|nr:hypothetical protein [Candidatus Dependentiae bacterium]
MPVQIKMALPAAGIHRSMAMLLVCLYILMGCAAATAEEKPTASPAQPPAQAATERKIGEIPTPREEDRSWWAGFASAGHLAFQLVHCYAVGRLARNVPLIPEKCDSCLRILGDVATGYALTALATVAHELGHIGAYRSLIGSWPTQIKLGSSCAEDAPIISCGRLSLVGLNPLAGMAHYQPMPRAGRTVLIGAAGPLSGIAACVTLGLGTSSLLQSPGPDASKMGNGRARLSGLLAMTPMLLWQCYNLFAYEIEGSDGNQIAKELGLIK